MWVEQLLQGPFWCSLGRFEGRRQFWWPFFSHQFRNRGKKWSSVQFWSNIFRPNRRHDLFFKVFLSIKVQYHPKLNHKKCLREFFALFNFECSARWAFIKTSCGFQANIQTKSKVRRLAYVHFSKAPSVQHVVGEATVFLCSFEAKNHLCMCINFDMELSNLNWLEICSAHSNL